MKRAMRKLLTKENDHSGEFHVATKNKFQTHEN